MPEDIQALKKSAVQSATKQDVAKANDDAAKAERIAKAKELQALNESYKAMVGKSYNDGERDAEVREYVPVQLVKGRYVPAFLVNYGHQNISYFVSAEEFKRDFKEKGK